MERLYFCEIKKMYREKYKRNLCSTNDKISTRLEGYQTYQVNGQYFIKTKNKQKESEKIVDLLHTYNEAYYEKDIIKKYNLLIKTLPEQYLLSFPKTVGYHEKYVSNLMETRKNKNAQMVHAFNALKTMLSLMNKELSEYSNVELVELIKNEIFTSTQKQHTVWFLTYIYNLMPEHFNFNVEMTMLKREKIKAEDDFYSLVEWGSLLNTFLDIDKHLDNAYRDHFYARYWLYVVLHFSLAWRKSDILNFPSLEILIDVEKYTLEWFENHAFTINEAQKIINSIKLVAEQYSTQKTGARKHFNIPRHTVITTAIAFIICEQWRRRKGDSILFGMFVLKAKAINKRFPMDIEFSSLKANRTLLSFFSEKASEIDELSGQASFLTSYMRSHKTTLMGTSDTTIEYLRSNYDERMSLDIGKQIIDRGAFGWLYNKLIDMAGSKKATFRENTMLIAEVRKSTTVQQLDKISGLLLDCLKTERTTLLDEIYSWSEEEIKEKTTLLLSGKLLSKTEDVYCLVSGKCPYPTENKCMLCKYSIPTVFSLMLVGNELKRLLEELGMTNEEYKIDRIRYTYQIGRLILIAHEAVEELGREYVESFIVLEEINNLIKTETNKMIFLEEK